MIGAISPWHLLVILAIIVLLFGRGRISALMGDMAKAIKTARGIARN